MKRLSLFCIVVLSASLLSAEDLGSGKYEDSSLSAPAGGCDYVIGDVNASGIYNGLDIIWGVSYFKGGLSPICPCEECNPGDSWYICGDVNSSCSYNGLDITYGINYFKGIGPVPMPCPDCPPI